MKMYDYENKAYSLGAKTIAGCDEVGRGPLAGPVVCAAVVLHPNVFIEGLDDSKKLSEKRREELYLEIKEKALDYQVIFIDEKTIDEINIYQASKLGMIKAIQALKEKPDYVLSDAMKLTGISIPYEAIIKGDQKSASIAAASILAKVERDHYMVSLKDKYPEYGFERHKGYPTKKHIEALKKYGVLDIHRRSFKPVRDCLNKQSSLF